MNRNLMMKHVILFVMTKWGYKKRFIIVFNE